ncbi:MAG: hypothetical protein SAK42_11535 [Oscillatoria sp. PMC 1076.18]|nr:hypothetical protein [Oscillatoria sp. PMC 1076.18]
MREEAIPFDFACTTNEFSDRKASEFRFRNGNLTNWNYKLSFLQVASLISKLKENSIYLIIAVAQALHRGKASGQNYVN